jgi:hypothetical protein
MPYSAFGLSLDASRPIPGLLTQSGPLRPDIEIRFHDESEWCDIGDSVERAYYSSPADGEPPALRVWKTSEHFRLRYADDTQFIVATSGRTIRAIVPAASTLEDAATYLLGPVLGFAMRLRGIPCLHASVVAIGDGAIAIAGPAGAGKSTTAACFASMGYRVLADDIAAVVVHDGRWHVQPAYPQLRLWPDSVGMLFGRTDALPPLTPTWDKCALALGEEAFARQPLPLEAIYVLGEERPDDVDVFNEVNGAERLRVLLANTYVGYLLDAPLRQQEFDCLVRIATTVPVRKVNRRRDGAVRATCTHLIDDLKSLHVQHH